jgi:hypothetical protein
MLFWTVYGLNPTFEMILGWIEVGTGLLLLFRRTAFAGALLALGVTTNVALLDLAFDVPVKLFALTLVLLSLALLTPEASRLRRFLCRLGEQTPPKAWAPEARTIRGRRIAFAAEILFAALVCWQWGSGAWRVYEMKMQASRSPAPFTGEWVVQGSNQIMSANNTPITRFFFDPDTDMILQDASGAMWRSRSIYNRESRVLRVLYEPRPMIFRVDQPSNDLLQLVPLGPRSAELYPISMRRKALPGNYPLLQTKFHWVNNSEPLH